MKYRPAVTRATYYHKNKQMQLSVGAVRQFGLDAIAHQPAWAHVFLCQRDCGPCLGFEVFTEEPDDLPASEVWQMSWGSVTVDCRFSIGRALIETEERFRPSAILPVRKTVFPLYWDQASKSFYVPISEGQTMLVEHRPTKPDTRLERPFTVDPPLLQRPDEHDEFIAPPVWGKGKHGQGTD